VRGRSFLCARPALAASRARIAAGEEPRPIRDRDAHEPLWCRHRRGAPREASPSRGARLCFGRAQRVGRAVALAAAGTIRRLRAADATRGVGVDSIVRSAVEQAGIGSDRAAVIGGNDGRSARREQARDNERRGELHGVTVRWPTGGVRGPRRPAYARASSEDPSRSVLWVLATALRQQRPVSTR